jgi:hypothetical protein
VSASGHPTSGERAKLTFAVMGTFAVICPPVGTLTYFFMVALLEMTVKTTSEPYVAAVWFVLLYGIPLGYFVLVLPAIIAGAVVGRWQALRGRMRWWLALAIGAVAGLGVQVTIGNSLLPLRGTAHYVAGQELIPVAALAIATLAAWAMIRKRYFLPSATARSGNST